MMTNPFFLILLMLHPIVAMIAMTSFKNLLIRKRGLSQMVAYAISVLCYIFLFLIFWIVYYYWMVA